MTLYEKYRRLKIDFSQLGLEKGSSHSDYFCTPKGAKVIAWAGVNGIHYCFLKDFGEMVFSVSPMNQPSEYVHPLAKNFEDFLRLLLVCGNLAALEQAHAWKQEQFDNFLKENRPTQEQIALLDILTKKFSLTPMEQPFTYIKELQSSFDYSKIRFKDNVYKKVSEETKKTKMPEWKVFFNANFWGHCGRDHAGKELRIDQQFVWGENIWHIPALYICGSGLVVDFCVEVEPEAISAFMSKWHLQEENIMRSDEEQEKINAENPLSFDFNAKLELNGKILSQKHGCGISWIPSSCLFEGVQEQEAKWVLEHYGLNQERGWAIHRITFPWSTKKKPSIQSLKLLLKQNPISIFGIHFVNPKLGESISFHHPITGVEHILTVQEYEQQEINQQDFMNEKLEYPTYYITMTYTLSPELPSSAFSISDCAQSDRPRKKDIAVPFSQAPNTAAVNIIGGADGATAIFICSSHKSHTACSALHFKTVDEVEWRMVFHEKMQNDMEVKLLG